MGELAFFGFLRSFSTRSRMKVMCCSSVTSPPWWANSSSAFLRYHDNAPCVVSVADLLNCARHLFTAWALPNGVPRREIDKPRREIGMAGVLQVGCDGIE